MAGPNPTFAQAWTQFGQAVNVLDALELFGNSASPNWLDREDAAITGRDGRYTPSALAALRRMRQSVAAPLERSRIADLLRPHLREMVHIVSGPEAAGGTDVEMLARIRQAMIDGGASVGGSAQTINSRGMTLDTSQTAVGSPVGGGTIRRCTVDKDGHTLECTGGEVKIFECVQDQTSGARRHNEVFEFRTAAFDAEFRGLNWIGSGLRIPNALRVPHAKSSNLLRNGSFDSNDASADNATPGSTTAVTDWVLGSAANFALRSNSSYLYRDDHPGAPSSASNRYGLEFLANDSVTQTIATQSPGSRFDPRVSYFCRVAWAKFASCTGILTLALGSQTTNVDVSTGTNGVYSHLYIPLTSAAYYANFVQEAITVSISMRSLAVGTVGIDDVILVPMVNLDGTYWVVDGDDTPFLRGDGARYYTLTDVEGGSRAKNSYWLWRGFGAAGWLPSNAAGAETIADPA